MIEQELQHHGILGQKWGVRRYQNSDGTLTSAGRAHYGVGPSNDDSSPKGKSVSEMSNRELRDVTERLRLQKDYERAKNEYSEETKSYTSKKLAQLRDKTIDSLITKTVEAATSAFVRKVFGIPKTDNNKGGGGKGGGDGGGSGKGGKGGSMGVGSIRENLGITDEMRFEYRRGRGNGYTIRVRGPKPKK